MIQTSTTTAGIDTSKSKLDIALHGRSEHWQVANSLGGWRELTAKLVKADVGRVGIEATGGYERGVVEHLRAAGITVLLLQPMQVKAFGRAHLRRAKNDVLDAVLIAAFTASLDQVRSAPDPRLAELAEQLTFLEQTEEDIRRYKTRLEIQIEVSQSCETCHGSGSTPGTGTRRCNLCSGYGKVRAKQGFFVVERDCPNCHGRGEVIESPCRSCGGEGRVDKAQKLDVEVPPGVDSGTRIRLSGKGEAGPRGAPPGDLYIFVHVKPHAIFTREGTTLVTRVPVSFTTAALGGTIELPGLDGKAVEVGIPVGIQSGEQLRQRGVGMPVLQGRGRGDLVVEVQVETPTKMSREQRTLLEQFRDLETGDECPASRGFFDKIKTALGG